jgi:hypothetical protein
MVNSIIPKHKYSLREKYSDTIEDCVSNASEEISKVIEGHYHIEDGEIPEMITKRVENILFDHVYIPLVMGKE